MRVVLEHTGREIEFDAKLIVKTSSEVGRSKAWIKLYWEYEDEQYIVSIQMNTLNILVYFGDLEEVRQWAIQKVKDNYWGSRAFREVVSDGERKFSVFKEGDMCLFFLRFLYEVENLIEKAKPKRKPGRPPKKAKGKAVST